MNAAFHSHERRFCSEGTHFIACICKFDGTSFPPTLCLYEPLTNWVIWTFVNVWSATQYAWSCSKFTYVRHTLCKWTFDWFLCFWAKYVFWNFCSAAQCSCHACRGCSGKLVTFLSSVVTLLLLQHAWVLWLSTHEWPINTTLSTALRVC